MKGSDNMGLDLAATLGLKPKVMTIFKYKVINGKPCVVAEKVEDLIVDSMIYVQKKGGD